MSKTIRNIWNKKFTMEYFLMAHYRARKGKSSNKEVVAFEMDLETNLVNIMKQIENGSFHFGKYRTFTILEPKKRIIKSLPYKDRVVHQWYVEEFIKPYMLPRFIYHTYACLPEKVGHKAVDDLQVMMRKMKRTYGHYYVLKCDIQDYFHSINRDILFQLMKEKISDKQLLNFTRKIIFGESDDTGIPIGNYTSQFFANIYLNELDHYVKENLGVKYYVRYMDDFILLCRDKEEAKKYYYLLERFVGDKLKLKFNRKSRYYPNSLGVDFCGYITYETHRKLRKRSKKGMRKKIKHWNKEFENGTLDFQKVQKCWNSWLGHISHANTFHLMMQYREKMIFLKEYSDRF